MDEKEYYNILAGRFKSKFNEELNGSLKRQIRSCLRDFCSYVPVRSSRILDAGCHEGHALKQLKRLKYINAEGIEYLPLLVRAVHRKYCRAQQGDLHNLYMFTDGIFDAVFSRYVLEHCHTPSKVMRELARVTKVDGIIYIVVSSEIGRVSTRQGLTVFKSIDDFKALVPNNMKTIKIEELKTAMGWYDILYIGKV